MTNIWKSEYCNTCHNLLFWKIGNRVGQVCIQTSQETETGLEGKKEEDGGGGGGGGVRIIQKYDFPGKTFGRDVILKNFTIILLHKNIYRIS